jgi:hypothetical protein
VLSDLPAARPRGPTIDARHIRSTRGVLPLQLSNKKFRVIEWGAENLVPPAGSQPPLRWARGHCQYPVNRVPSCTGSKSRERAGRASAHSHMACSSGSRLLARECSSAAMCPMVPDPASQLGRTLVQPHVLWLRTPPLSTDGLQCCHVSHGSGSRLPMWAVSDAVICPAALSGMWAM